jgi:hypothetical protein
MLRQRTDKGGRQDPDSNSDDNLEEDPAELERRMGIFKVCNLLQKPLQENI